MLHKFTAAALRRLVPTAVIGTHYNLVNDGSGIRIVNWTHATPQPSEAAINAEAAVVEQEKTAEAAALLQDKQDLVALRVKLKNGTITNPELRQLINLLIKWLVRIDREN